MSRHVIWAIATVVAINFGGFWTWVIYQDASEGQRVLVREILDGGCVKLLIKEWQTREAPKVEHEWEKM